MPLILGNNGLTSEEFEKLRLLLSVFQDGTGMLSTEDHDKLYAKLSGKAYRKTQKKIGEKDMPYIVAQKPLDFPDIVSSSLLSSALREKSQHTLPGWRDFERVVALAFDGIALESKAIVDVVLPLHNGTFYGLSCKSRAMLNDAKKPGGRVNIEVSNASGGFWDHLQHKGVTQANYRQGNNPDIMGHALVEIVERWHKEVDISSGGLIDIEKSSYLILLYNNKYVYQLFQFPLSFPKADELTWSVPMKIARDEGKAPVPRKCLVASDKHGEKVIEWYFHSGGQLKYYPLTSSAVWTSSEFTLEPLPKGTKHGVLSKVEQYFPDLWKKFV